MKKVISFLVLGLMLISLTGCGEAKPETTVEKFFTSAQKFDAATMASTIVPTNTKDIGDLKEIMSEEQVSPDQAVLYEYLIGYMKSNAAKMTFKVTGSEINGDTAVVTVDCKYVDAGPVLRAAIGELMKKVISLTLGGTEVTEAQTYQIFADTMKEQEKLVSETYKEDTIKINCIKKDNAWYISELNDGMKDAITSGFISASKDMGQIFGGSN